MATFTNPSILLLDEHTAALDPSRAELITDKTREIVSKTKLTTLMVTHNMQQALDLGNRLIMMDKGQVIFEAMAAEKRRQIGDSAYCGAFVLRRVLNNGVFYDFFC